MNEFGVVSEFMNGTHSHSFIQPNTQLVVFNKEIRHSDNSHFHLLQSRPLATYWFPITTPSSPRRITRPKQITLAALSWCGRNCVATTAPSCLHLSSQQHHHTNYRRRPPHMYASSINVHRLSLLINLQLDTFPTPTPSNYNYYYYHSRSPTIISLGEKPDVQTNLPIMTSVN